MYKNLKLKRYFVLFYGLIVIMLSIFSAFTIQSKTIKILNDLLLIIFPILVFINPDYILYLVTGKRRITKTEKLMTKVVATLLILVSCISVYISVAGF